MAEALINLVLEQLVTVAFDHSKEAIKLILNAKTEVDKFSDNLKAVQAVLEDAEKQQVEKATVRNWLDRLNDVSYEMVNLLDEWNTEVLKQKANEFAMEKKRTSMKVCFSIPSNCFCFGLVKKATHLHKVATEMKELNEKLALIVAQKQNFEFQQSSTRSRDEQLIKPLKTSSFVDISTIFGREEAKANLLNMLLSDSGEKGTLIIPIVGMGGMGKTTLAQLAYNNEVVKTYFQNRIWVCVSDPFDEVKIAKAIIRGTGRAAPDSPELQDVLTCMSECLQGQKFLIVLDDVWNEVPAKWDSLKLPIIMETCAKDSKIVVTTRKERVAEIMGATTQMIHLEKLSDENCLALFNSIAYLGREEDETNGFGDVGEQIAKKCNGLPLAAKTLGSLMHSKKKRGEWREVLESKTWALKEVEQQVFQSLLLSYYELTPTVKRCLLYCATFPKNHQLDKQNLIELWMSQDYLTGKDYKEKEKTGRYIFNTLVTRSFFQDVVEERESDYDRSSSIICKMHDSVHDFVVFLNKNECFIIEPKEAGGSLSEEVRHLTILFASSLSPVLGFISAVHCKRLRTLATFDSKLSSEDLIAISQVKCLRTLTLSHNDFRELPEELGGLMHLRYLDLSWNRNLKKLPDSLGSLYNMQSLRLIGCMKLRRLPENMGNLINLRHLHNRGCHLLDYLPRGVARLTSLQTLNKCPVNHDDDSEGARLGDLGGLDQLQGSLDITIKNNLKDAASEAEKARLVNKKKLYSLSLSWKNATSEQSHGQVLEALRPHQDLEILSMSGCITTPSWMMSLQNLRSVSLKRWSGCECLPPLGKLPALENLHVEKMDKVERVGDEFLGIMDDTQMSFFPKLKYLTFWDLRKWKQWEGVGGDEITIMPCLVRLSIRRCPQLRSLPVFLQNTPVKEISMLSCRRSIIIPLLPHNCCIRIGWEINDPDETESSLEIVPGSSEVLSQEAGDY